METFGRFFGKNQTPTFDKDLFYSKQKCSLHTGDILLFNTRTWYSRILEYFLGCKISHVGIILKYPQDWIGEKLLDEDNYYVLESGYESCPDSVSGRNVIGVRLTPLSKILDDYLNKGMGKLYVRSLNTSHVDERDIQNGIRRAYESVKGKPYDTDVFDWINGYLDLNKNIFGDWAITTHYQKVDKFWCSALVSYVFVECGLMHKECPWTLVAPNDFFQEISCGRILPLRNCSLGKTKLLC